MNDETMNDKSNPIGEQNRAIKRRLQAYRNKLKPVPTYEDLATKLTTDCEFNVQWETLRTVFTIINTDKTKPEPKPNLNIVLALCSLWNLDRAAIFAPPPPPNEKADFVLPPKNISIPKENISQTSVSTLSLDAVPLNDKGYKGTFEGYMCSRSLNNKGITYFKLSIGETTDLEVFDSTSNRILNDSPRKYIGTPVLLKKAKKVYIVFSNAEITQKDDIDGAHFYIFCFDYSYYSGGLYYCKGIVITEDSKNHNMLAENFVLFKNIKKIDILKNEDQDTVRGLLSFVGVDDEIYVSQDVLEKLSDSEQLCKFIKKYEYNWLAHPSQGYYLRIEQVLGAVDKNNREELYSTIECLLRIISGVNTSTRHSYKDIDKLRIFVKEYLQDL